MMWGRKKIQGTVYDLQHLDPFILDVPRGGQKADYLVRVEFSCHTFTENYHSLHTPDLAISHGNDLRAFCLKRYAQSLHLEAAIRNAVNGIVYNSSGNPVVCATLPNLAGTYLIAFKIRKTKSPHFDAVMHVASAHHRPKFDLNVPTAPFPVAIAAGIAGAKIRWTKK